MHDVFSPVPQHSTELRSCASELHTSHRSSCVCKTLSLIINWNIQQRYVQVVSLRQPVVLGVLVQD